MTAPQQTTHLTVLKTSLFFAGDGFTAYDCTGTLLFRVDSYGDTTGELVLMDAIGRCILTLRRKRPSLHQRWLGYAGERIAGQKPAFSVRRCAMIGRSSVAVEKFGGGGGGEEYLIEGSFARRKCTVFNSEKTAVAEIRRKVDRCANVVLGKDVFVLSVESGTDLAFAMALVVVLDQIGHGDEAVAGGGKSRTVH